MDDRSQADLLDEIATLRQDLDEERGEHKATIGLLPQARQWQDVVEAAVAYYDAPEGSDQVVQCWYELKGAIEHWRAMQQAEPPLALDENATLRQELREARATSYRYADGSHRYVSPACLHGQHVDCAFWYRDTRCRYGNDPCMCRDEACAHRSVAEVLAAARMLNLRELPGEDGVWLINGPHEPQSVTGEVWMLQDAGWLDAEYRLTDAGLRVLEAES